MFKADAKEAKPIVVSALEKLLTLVPTRGRPGSNVRTAIGDLIASASELLLTDTIGKPLDRCFDLARICGIDIPDLDYVRRDAMSKNPQTPGAIVVRDSIVLLILATMGRIISDTTFTSRQDADQTQLEMNDRFEHSQLAVADDMDAATYFALVSLHAAIIFYLIGTARPLPRMVRFQFAAASLPTLVISYKLYDDAGRANELRAENKVVHPAFSPRIGRALSA